MSIIKRVTHPASLSFVNLILALGSVPTVALFSSTRKSRIMIPVGICSCQCTIIPERVFNLGGITDQFVRNKWSTSPVSVVFQNGIFKTPVNIGTRHDFVALVNLAKYYTFITDENGDLRKYIFESNVRDYQGHNAVNQDIQKTLENPSGEDFWWLNNGITLLTEEASLATSKELILKDPAIVNGLQTSNEIFQYYKKFPDALASENRNVLIRIIVPESEEIRDRIILATNNQTNIPKSSLRANDPIHWQIELFFKGRRLYYDRRKNYYKNQGIKSADIISVSFLAQCMISLLLQKPNYARARPSTLLSDDDYYNQLYSVNPDLDVFYNVATIGKKVEQYVKALDYSQAEKNDILFYVLYHVVAQHASTPSLTHRIIKSIRSDDISEEEIRQSSQIVYELYHRLGGNGKIAKSSELIDSVIKQLALSSKDLHDGEIVGELK